VEQAGGSKARALPWTRWGLRPQTHLNVALWLGGGGQAVSTTVPHTRGSGGSAASGVEGRSHSPDLL
jgi:hypothetical protein